MAGELWRGSFQMGLQPGAVAVPATRKMYYREPVLTKERESRPHRFRTGRRDNVHKRTSGPVSAGGSVNLAMSADEIIELLLLGVQGGVTPTQPSAGTDPTVYLWTFKPGNALDKATAEWHDGARPWREIGVQVNSLSISGEVEGENMVTADLFGTDMSQQALTGSLTDRIPTFIEGWETKVYIDALGGTPGTTVVGTLVKSWDISLNNNLEREYTADNTLAAADVNFGDFEVEASVVVKASTAAALTQFNNWESGAELLVRLEFGQNQVISNTYKRFVTIDIAGSWTAFDLGSDGNNARQYELSFGQIYDTALAASVQFRAQNTRSAAW